MRWLWATIGFLCLLIGAVGIVLPIWPTTIFWIIAAFCLAESHPKARDWIYSRPGIGSVIKTFIEQGQIDRKSKSGAVIGMILAGAISSLALRDNLMIMLVVFSTLVLVSIFIITRPEPEN